jgi:hypothetical protein
MFSPFGYVIFLLLRHHYDGILSTFVLIIFKFSA